jgi:hypothetical protein
VTNNERKGLLALSIAIVAIIIIGVGMMWFNRQSSVTPASSTGSMQEQLSPRTNPPR